MTTANEIKVERCRCLPPGQMIAVAAGNDSPCTWPDCVCGHLPDPNTPSPDTTPDNVT